MASRVGLPSEYRTWSEYLDNLLFMHAEGGMQKETEPFYDALYVLKYGRHMSGVREAPAGLVKTIRRRARFVQSRLSRKYPEGEVELFRGGDRPGFSWTDDEVVARMVVEAKGGKIERRSIPISSIVFDPTTYSRVGAGEVEEREYTVVEGLRR